MEQDNGRPVWHAKQLAHQDLKSAAIGRGVSEVRKVVDADMCMIGRPHAIADSVIDRVKLRSW